MSNGRAPITDQQIADAKLVLESAARKSGLDRDGFQRAVNNPGFKPGLVDLMRNCGTLKNPFSIVKASWDYPADFTMTDWELQLKALLSISVFSSFDPGDIEKRALMWLEQKDIWSQRFIFSKTGEEAPVFDGLAVSILPGRFIQKILKKDLWDDVSKGREGKGLWGVLCEEYLLPELARLFSPLPFTNYRRSEMGSDRFLPIDPVAKWYCELEEVTKGDFIVRPFSFGRRLAGYSVEASRWEIENLLKGVPNPTWLNGQTILTNPQRFPSTGHLAIDNAGDQYRFEDGSKFGRAPYFRRDGLEFCFRAYWISRAHDVFGIPFSAW